MLEDEIEVIPQGTSPGGFLIERYFEEGKMPGIMYDLALGYWYSRPVPMKVARVNTIPQQVTWDFIPHNIGQLHPQSHLQCLPADVKCVRVKRQKNVCKFIASIREATGDSLDGKALWFRGLSHAALILTLTLFIPVIHGNSLDSEFGPGIYATDDLGHALDYCPREGAIMVFKNPDLQGLKCLGA